MKFKRESKKKSIEKLVWLKFIQLMAHITFRKVDPFDDFFKYIYTVYP